MVEQCPASRALALSWHTATHPHPGTAPQRHPPLAARRGAWRWGRRGRAARGRGRRARGGTGRPPCRCWCQQASQRPCGREVGGQVGGEGGRVWRDDWASRQAGHCTRRAERMFPNTLPHPPTRWRGRSGCPGCRSGRRSTSACCCRRWRGTGRGLWGGGGGAVGERGIRRHTSRQEPAGQAASTLPLLHPHASTVRTTMEAAPALQAPERS